MGNDFLRLWGHRNRLVHRLGMGSQGIGRESLDEMSTLHNSNKLICCPHEQDSPEEDRRITDSELEYLRTAIGVTNEESVMSPPWKAMMTSLPGKLKIAIRGGGHKRGPGPFQFTEQQKTARYQQKHSLGPWRLAVQAPCRALEGRRVT